MTDKIVDIDELVPDPDNVRVHPEKNKTALTESLLQFGAARSVVMDADGIIRAGSGTVESAKEAGIKTARIVEGNPDELIVVKRSDLQGEKATAYAIADNRTAELADWDLDALQTQLSSLEDFDAYSLGFDDKDLKDLFPTEDGELDDVVPQTDRADELQEEWKTSEGQLWAIGKHRLLCGDSTSEQDVARLLDGETPFIMVTDPPYGVQYDPTFRSSNRTGVVVNDDRADWGLAYKMFPGVVGYVWHGNLHVAVVAEDLQNAGFQLRSYILWKKPHLVMGRGHYHWQHEPLFYGARGSAKWCGDRSQSTVWDIQHVHPTLGTTDDGETIHGTQKPIECMARPIRNHGDKDDDVYDPFLGSGTTMLAAEQLGRRCFGMEISPKYSAVILQRMSDAGCECSLVD